MLKISIPKPCHEDWSAMTPDTQGRHCTSCAKTVVDFTNMSDEAIKHFLINKKEERVCGRFRNEQLQRITIELPQNIFHLQMPFWKQFLVASLLAFSVGLFSCDTIVKGEPNIATPNEYSVKEYNTGKALLPIPPPPPQVCTNTVGVVFAAPDDIKGDVQVILPPTVAGEIGIIEVPDSATLKNPPKTDSIDCNKQTYY